MYSYPLAHSLWIPNVANMQELLFLIQEAERHAPKELIKPSLWHDTCGTS
jgi:hypothetical protein